MKPVTQAEIERLSAGPFTIRTSTYKARVVLKWRTEEWHIKLEELELLSAAINEYLHMRSVESPEVSAGSPCCPLEAT